MSPLRRGAIGALILLAGTAALPAGPLRAQDGSLTGLEQTRSALDAAGAALRSAQTREERVAAVAGAIRAHEAALAEMRAGLRRLAAEDRRLADELDAERATLGALLGALMTLSRAPEAAVLAYPGGPVAASRSASMLAGLESGLRAQAEALHLRLETLTAVRTREELARAEAQGALAALQALRAEAARGARAAPDGAATRQLRAQAESAARTARDLAGLAETLAALPDPMASGRPDTASTSPHPDPFEALRGTLAPPVEGRLAARFGDDDPWGRPGEGLSFAAPAYAPVLAPVAGTVRYAGPLLDYDTVVILEPADGWLLVLAGLGQSGRMAGETVLAGDRLGDLGGPRPASEEFLLEAADGDSHISSEALYLELRRAGAAVDPEPWFASTGK